MTDPRTWSDIANNCWIVFMTSSQVALCFLVLAGVLMATIVILLGFAVIVDKALLKMAPDKKVGDE